jgi:uncharacterized protein (DUF4213/DUF364 family)
MSFMTNKELYKMLKYSFKDILDDRRIHEKTVSVAAKDFDGIELPYGKEVTLTAEYEGAIGECSTSFACCSEPFKETLSRILELDIENDPYERSIYIAGLNAVMNKYKLADDCVSCSEEDKIECAEYMVRNYKKSNGVVNTLLVGYQPHILKALAANFPVRLLDLDPDNIGKVYSGITAGHGADDFADAVKWADLILCTGSSFSNGTIVNYINLPKDVSFYGTTIAGCARVLGLRRLCPYARN